MLKRPDVSASTMQDVFRRSLAQAVQLYKQSGPSSLLIGHNTAVDWERRDYSPIQPESAALLPQSPRTMCHILQHLKSFKVVTDRLASGKGYRIPSSYWRFSIQSTKSSMGSRIKGHVPCCRLFQLEILTSGERISGQ